MNCKKQHLGQRTCGLMSHSSSLCPQFNEEFKHRINFRHTHKSISSLVVMSDMIMLFFLTFIKQIFEINHMFKHCVEWGFLSEVQVYIE